MKLIPTRQAASLPTEREAINYASMILGTGAATHRTITPRTDLYGGQRFDVTFYRAA